MPLATPHAPPHGNGGRRLNRARPAVAWLALLVCCSAQTTLLAARSVQAAASSPYDRAMRLREALEGRPQRERTLRDYERALEAFRAVYRDGPRSPHADASADAVAGLLAEQGRLFELRRASQDAVSQYEFLRREYPASPYRYGALLTEGEIYKRDLNDRLAARTIFKLFLELYPQNALAGEARQELKGLQVRGGQRAQGISGRQTAGHRLGSPGGVEAGPHRNSTVLAAALASQAAPPAGSLARASPPPSAGSLPNQASPHPAQASSFPATQPPPGQQASTPGTLVERDLPSGAQAAPAGPEVRRGQQPHTPLSEASLDAHPPLRQGRLPLVTGVRHWSTSVYTRVAIDLDREVRYEASRVPNPDRIFFDLHGARLSPELSGKAVTVTDGGYLKRIRAAQSSGDVVRVVLDVSDVSEYSAFFLPNPARLIIDIHGKAHGPALHPSPAVEIASSSPPALGSPGQASQRKSAAAPVPIHRIVVDGGLSASAGAHTRSGSPSTPAADSLGDIATLDREPNAVRATRSPTTAPVAAVVSDTTPAAQPGTVLAPAPDLTGKHAHTPGAEAKAARAHGITPVDTPAPAVHAADPLDPPASVRAAAPTATGERSMVRALGLKIGRIVVDAGHGGHDSGTLGPGGIEEKDVVLDVALRLGRLLKQRLGADVIYTRDDDTFIPLETRTAIANKAQADLFLSVHANSSQDSSARGVETYYLNFTSSADALEVAARENAVSDQSIHQLSDLVKKITLQDKISESREFAGDVEQSLYTGLEAGNPGFRDRGVKKAPFVVLIGANMPSILAEISFLTNPDDAHQLRDPEYRQRIAESLYKGVAKYIGSLSGVRLAEGSTRPAGQ